MRTERNFSIVGDQMCVL